MKKLWNDYSFVILSIGVWRLALEAVRVVSPYLFPLRTGYLGPSVWANFDGIHYLRIAGSGYFQYGEAFFPLYPMLVRIIGLVFPIPDHTIGSVLSFACFSAAITILYAEVKRTDAAKARRVVAGILMFPTAFFFNAVYTEGLFLLLSVLVWRYSRTGDWLLAGLFGALAASTRLVGVLLLIVMAGEYLAKRNKFRWTNAFPAMVVPSGLVAYMAFLRMRSGDPLAFFHVQPLFGANRSGSEIILLPQVIWRYIKIFATVPAGSPDFLVALLEIAALGFAAFALYLGLMRKLPISLVAYAALLVLVPTLTGTLSSLPRYIAPAFPLFIALSEIRSRSAALVYAMGGILLQALLAAAFMSGWFVS